MSLYRLVSSIIRARCVSKVSCDAWIMVRMLTFLSRWLAETLIRCGLWDGKHTLMDGTPKNGWVVPDMHVCSSQHVQGPAVKSPSFMLCCALCGNQAKQTSWYQSSRRRMCAPWFKSYTDHLVNSIRIQACCSHVLFSGRPICWKHWRLKLKWT